MKKLAMLFVSVVLLVFITACGNDEANTTKVKDKAATESKTEQKTKDTATHAVDPTEPHNHSKCAFCNMKVYTRTDEMGAFTAQAVTKDGKHLFFDDSGCLLNGQRTADEQYEKTWVRDAVTKDWIETDKAVVVKSDQMTPMKYGYSFFSSQEEADQFITDHQDKHAVIATLDDLDQVANERYQKKMQNMNNNEHHDSETEMNDHSESNGHE